MQDMGPRDRSIRNIPIPQSHRQRRDPAHRPWRDLARSDDESGDYPQAESGYESQPPRPPRSRGKKWFWVSAGVVVVLCVVGGLLLSTLFAGASVVVFERQEVAEGPVEISASLNPSVGLLGYALMSGTRSATTTVPATGTREVSRTASGVITVYNNYSTESQRLIARTRFEAPDGKVYRIQDSITVPGATENSGGERVPGSLEVTIYADAPGVSYNRTGETDYTLPALKGDQRYDTMYAEGTTPISGGFEGPEPAVADDDLARAETALKQGLAQAAQTALASQIPAGYLAVPGTLEVTYSNITQVAGDNNTALLSQTATMQAAIVKVDDLANAVAKQKVSGYEGEAVTFADPTQLVLVAEVSEESENELPLTLTGDLTLRWRYDGEALKAALVGQEKSKFETIIQSFAPAISRAEAKVRPFWDSSFPNNPDDIEVIAGVQ